MSQLLERKFCAARKWGWGWLWSLQAVPKIERRSRFASQVVDLDADVVQSM